MFVTNLLVDTGRIFYGIVDSIGFFLQHITYISDLVWKTFTRVHLLIKNINLTIRQMYIIGVESLLLVAVTSVFIGGEVIVQANFLIKGFIPLRYLGYLVSKALITELCPVLTSFVVSSRIATAIAAEIGAMKTSEQLDAMTCLNLDSIRYLIVPKVVAAIIMMPVLVIFSELIAFIGSLVTALMFVDITMYQYLASFRLFFSLQHMMIGIVKTCVFGAIIAFTGAHFGYQAQKGARGVGEATTRAVTLSMILILVFDFLIAFLTLR